MVLDRLAVVDIGGELADLLDDQAGVGADLGEEQVERRRGKAWRRAILASASTTPSRASPSPSLAADEGEIGVFLAPLGKRPPAVDGCGRDEDGGLRGVHLRAGSAAGPRRA